MRLSGTKTGAVNQYRGLGNQLWDLAGNRPSLDLPFSDTKSLVDATTGTNLVDFTRASSGTYVGSDGLIKTATTDAPRFDHDPTTGESLGLLVEESRTNLLEYSEEFTSWSQTIGGGIVLTANAASDPAGGNTATLIENNGTAGYIGDTTSWALNTTYTISGYLKAGTGDSATILLYSAGGNSGHWNSETSNVAVTFDLTNGTSETDLSSVAPTSSSITDAGNGWWRCSITATCTTANNGSQQLIRNTSGNTDGIYAWGFQVEEGSFPTSYIPTFDNPLGVTRAADVADISGNNFGTTNLLTYSEEFDRGAWAVTGAPTLTPNATIAPNGTMTADRLQSAGGGNGIQQVLNLELAPHNYSLYVKQAGLDSAAYVRLSIGPAYFSFDLVNGTFSDVDASFSTPVATQVENGWWRISGTRTTTATANAIRIWGVTGGSPSDVYIWGAQLEQSDVVTPYVKSNVTWDSRASNATYYDSTGTIRKSSYNELLWSEEFNDGAWTKYVAGTGSVPVVTPNQALAPDGTLSADLLVLALNGGTTSSDRSDISQNVTTVVGQPYTMSVWLKTSDGSTKDLQLSFNGANTSVVSVTGAWQRFVNTNPSAIDTIRYFRLALRGSVGTSDSASLHIWGAQLEKGTYAGDYAKTEATAASTARNAAYLPDDNGNFVSAGPLLLEEQRTNVITNNTMVGAVAGTPGTLPTNWGNFISPAGVTRSIVGTGTQNGVKYVDVKFAGTPSTTSEITLYLNGGIAASQGQAWAFTSWLAIAGGSTSNIASIRLRSFEQNSGAYVRETSTDVAPSVSADLFRFLHLTSSFGSGANEIRPVITVYASAAGIPIDVTLRIGLPQLEQGAFATSVIPTYGIAATRSADVSTSTSEFGNSWYRQDEGTVFADSQRIVLPVSGDFPQVFFISDGTGDNTLNLGYITASASQFRIRTAGNNEANLLPNVVTLRRVTAGAYAANDAAASEAGSSVSVDSSVVLPSALSQLDIGSGLIGANPLNGTIRRLTYWQTRLPNETLQTITN